VGVNNNPERRSDLSSCQFEEYGIIGGINSMVERSASIRKDDKRPGKVALFLRLTRFQFIPLIILPALAGTALAYSSLHTVDFAFLGLVLVGVVMLHLGANAIDDSYDFQNGVDQIANSAFPRDFGGWKPIPRGHMSLRDGKIVSATLFVLSMLIGVYFWLVVGPWAFVLGFLGFLLAFFYCAPPLKLDYRGAALGELAIFLSFGPIPVLGAYYVQTGSLGLSALLVSIPIGIMTVTVLIDHDLIFYEVYSKARKLSLGTVLGRKNALLASLGLTLVSYGMVFILALTHVLPIWSIAAPVASGALLLRKRSSFVQPNQPPPFYVSFTENGLFANWLFTLILVLSIVF
jgi:1,4-dihydroxy-2-naphthoate polyprenyltransferase